MILCQSKSNLHAAMPTIINYRVNTKSNKQNPSNLKPVSDVYTSYWYKSNK